MSADLDLALAAAGAAAAIIRGAIDQQQTVEYKGLVDPVTAIDKEAEAAIIHCIRSEHPHDLILSEEAGGPPWNVGRVWICDPLDGTVNFLHGVPHVSVSIGLWEDGGPRLGVVIDVMREEVFAARAGHGATLNGRPITVSETTEPRRALIVTGFPYDRHLHAADYLRPVEVVLERYQGIRRLGSAALDLCWTACGRFDGYWEYTLKPWDAAAGTVILEEAGGILTDPDGRRHNLDTLTSIAGNPHIQPDLAATVIPHIPAHLR